MFPGCWWDISEENQDSGKISTNMCMLCDTFVSWTRTIMCTICSNMLVVIYWLERNYKPYELADRPLMVYTK